MGNGMPGFGGHVLTIDLTREQMHISGLSKNLVLQFIGGKGFAAKLLWDELNAGIDPLSPDNIVIFANGPFTGTLAPTGSRCVLGTKSPLTGIWLDSNCGGGFGPELKAAGFDLVIIKGKASSPKYVLIDNDNISFNDASDLWGKDTFSVHKVFAQRYGGDYKVACIGMSGEKQVLLAGVQAEGRSFGRGGGGAVLGSKNLKALVVRGSRSINIYNYDDFIRSCREAYGEIGLSPDTAGSRPRYGTNGIYSFIREAGVLPLKNFQGLPYRGMEKVDEDIIRNDLYEADRACFACPIACSKYSLVKKGKYKGTFGEGPEYENIWSFGAQCGNTNLGAILKAEYLCDYYGLDAISVGNIIGFLMECYEREIIDAKSIGFPVSFGDDRAIIELVHLIGQAKGIGQILGSGVARASEYFGKGSCDFAMHVKGLEMPAYEPRGAVGMGLAYATSDRGACHLRAWPVGSEILDRTGRLDPLSGEYKAELVKTEQDWFAVIDSVGLCLFVNFGISPNQLTKLLYSLTGIPEFSRAENLMHIGERIYNLTRLFNLREGITRNDDTLPYRLLKEGLQLDPARGNTVPLEEMLNDYYLIRGWDRNGKPTFEHLKVLNLDDCKY